MFTGIVTAVGRVVESRVRGGDRRMTFDIGDALGRAADIGSSIAVNGVCLTAVESAPGVFTADVSAETLSVTTLGRWSAGTRVNIEPALRVGDALGGHWVSGHVDGVGIVRELSPAARSTLISVGLPVALARYVALKGSVAVDGVSLTINAVQQDGFEVNIVPHTQQATIIDEYAIGTAVNIEVDVIARYLERLAQYSSARGN